MATRFEQYLNDALTRCRNPGFHSPVGFFDGDGVPYALGAAIAIASSIQAGSLGRRSTSADIGKLMERIVHERRVDPIILALHRRVRPHIPKCYEWMSVVFDALIVLLNGPFPPMKEKDKIDAFRGYSAMKQYLRAFFKERDVSEDQASMTPELRDDLDPGLDSVGLS